MEIVDYSISTHDAIDGLKQPFEHGLFLGQEEAEAQFLSTVNSGRLHHAWLLTGPKGVGKATFAFRVARHFLNSSDNLESLESAAFDIAASKNNPTFKQVAIGGHPNLLHLRMPYDEKSKKFKTQLTVDEIRRTVSFFGKTAGEKGWRVAIVDSANDMNGNAANALLKILEEPTERTIFFLISETPNRLLPTIRSRCRTLKFKPLNVDDMTTVLAQVADMNDIEKAGLDQNQDVIAGSIRRAHLFASHDILDIRNAFTTLINQSPSYDVAMLHRFADTVSARGKDDLFVFFVEFVETHIASKIRGEGINPALVSWAEVWEKVQARLALEERLNLDRKQTVLALFQDMRINTHS